MRSTGSPPIVRLIGASLVTVAGIGTSLAGCSSDPVRKSGNDGVMSTAGDGVGGSGTAGTGSPAGGTGNAGTGTAGTDPGTSGTGPSAGTGGTGTGGDTSGVGGTGAGTGGDATGATGGSSSGAAGASAAGGSGGSMPCQMANYTFAPKIPTIFMLVDQSGSMFDCQQEGMGEIDNACSDHNNTSWFPLKDAALELIEALQGEVRFGFSAFGGEETNGPECPNMNPVTPDFNNYDSISTAYNALGGLRKGETPTSAALDVVRDILLADDSPGDRFILFVTDGEPDYCDDLNKLCPPDSVIYKLQALAEQGIKTLILGMPAPVNVSALGPEVLQAFANAGDGQPVMRVGTTDPNALWDQCRDRPGWAADFALTGKPNERGQEIATYSEADGTATIYAPESTNQAELIEVLRSALSNVKSCTFDLSNVNGQ
ncbi:MAG TPA: vWA domain-containing protein, partial [Polyangiaceae bacterium]